MEEEGPKKGGHMEGREGAPDSPYLTDNLKDYPTELNLLSENSTKRSCSAGEMIYIQSEASRPSSISSKKAGSR